MSYNITLAGNEIDVTLGSTAIDVTLSQVGQQGVPGPQGPPGADGDGAGTVTSIDITAGDGILSSGGPVTSSGSITVSLDTDFVETTTLNAQTGTTYTLALTDRGQTVTMDNAAANTVTIPANASAAFDIGSVVTVIMKGAGTTTITGATGVTVNGSSAGSVSISAQYQGVSLLKTGTNEWIASGALA